MARGPQIITIYWRDIPAQVNGVPPRVRGAGRPNKHQELLLPRFQKAIDRAAMVADITTATAYVAEWRQEPVGADSDDHVASAKAEAERLDQEFTLEKLNEFVATGGWDPARPESERTTSSPDNPPEIQP